MSTHHYVACDLGAESGRVILGTLANNRLTIEEVHRFPNGPVRIGTSLRWDLLQIFRELTHGLAQIGTRGIPVAGISCDSWGVDYVYLHAGEPMLGVPFHYRDSRTDGACEKAFSVVPAEEIYAETGIQFMSINTLYQLLDDMRERPGIVRAADRFLLVGDYFNYVFSGVARAEESLASTSQIYNPRTHAWSSALIDRFDLPPSVFPDVVPSGTLLGPMSPALAAETGIDTAVVIAGCSHDTGAAVAAVPMAGNQSAYLSSGTWSLLGTEVKDPILTSLSRSHGFTNEVGFGGSIRLLRNIAGLWLLQECRREWARQGTEHSYEDLMAMAAATPPGAPLLDLSNPMFAVSGNMPETIRTHCTGAGRVPPSTPGEITRCILESLAHAYAGTLDRLEEIIGHPLTTLHIVGGGCANSLLNQLTADFSRRTVLAGPVECTAIGNILVQAIALGHLPSLAAAREIVRTSFPPVAIAPSHDTYPHLRTSS